MEEKIEISKRDVVLAYNIAKAHGIAEVTNILICLFGEEIFEPAKKEKDER